MSHADGCRCPSCAYSICRAMRRDLLPIFQIFDRPFDAPDHVVVRLFTNDQPTVFMWRHSTVDAARASLDGLGLYCIPRDPSDPPTHVESWL